VYSISGTPSTSGTASFPISLGGKSCTITVPVIATSACVNSQLGLTNLTNTTYTIGGNPVLVNTTGTTNMTNIVTNFTRCGVTVTNMFYSTAATGKIVLTFSKPVNNIKFIGANLYPGLDATIFTNSTGTTNITNYYNTCPGQVILSGNTLSGSGSYGNAIVNINATVPYTVITIDTSTSSNQYYGFCFEGSSSSNDQVQAAVTGLTCTGAPITGSLTSGSAASGVSVSVPYTGGNNGSYSAQTVNSTGVITGLTATLPAGTLSTSGSVVYRISGTPSASGTASFPISLGGQSCTLSIPVGSPNPTPAVVTINSGGSGQSGEGGRIDPRSSGPSTVDSPPVNSGNFILTGSSNKITFNLNVQLQNTATIKTGNGSGSPDVGTGVRFGAKAKVYVYNAITGASVGYADSGYNQCGGFSLTGPNREDSRTCNTSVGVSGTINNLPAGTYRFAIICEGNTYKDTLGGQFDNSSVQMWSRNANVQSSSGSVTITAL
jgi:hypothetical protein